jgi:cytochrome P450
MRFDPDRWSPEEVAKRPRYSYFPFGGGQRACIGELFAREEMSLVLGTLLQRWSPELIPGQTVGTAPVITLRADGPIMMRMHKR